jgi:iron(III) transport system substrate-binding protein
MATLAASGRVRGVARWFLRTTSAMLRPMRFPALLLLALAAGCAKEPDLVVYCALDQVFSEPLIRRFEAESGLRVRAEFDIEADKTIGLVRRIEEEARTRPRCDVFWNNEIAQSVGLADRGLLAVYDSPSAAGIPETFRDPQRRWTGFAARARIFIVNTERADPGEIHGMWDLVDPRWSGQVGMARPLTGTTLTHMTALYTVLGEAEARRYLERVKELSSTGAVSLAPGNSQVMRLVASGQLAWGWTDTDDFHVALERGDPVAAVYPDADGVGTLLIPNTIEILAAAPHPDAARRFVDWVLRPEIEAELARSRSAQIPVRPDVPRPAGMKGPGDFKVMPVDFRKVGAELEARDVELRKLFLD